ncbi:hypothetical protein MVEN_01458500 [Mycena venus]|uniref:Uncharacterized protein n=1 Tax=Mycena venus TaxID=2733690 RepID=A0A8H6XVC7_9AGAR|nr:hypothetical protein MVEN_01458500 [Mycena venus]
MASFGTTISSGIQDISAILSLFGTEQCELHIGSALRGAGRGGYLYAAIAPLSIFGSLGTAKAAFTIMVISLPLGARMLKTIGFEPKGDGVVPAMLERDSDRFLAETRLLKLLDRHYIRSAQHISVERPAFIPRLIPLRPWNFSLLIASLFVAFLGVLPYLHFSIRHHTSFPALAIFFPICRVVGGLLCVFPAQLLLQYRIQMIMKQRLLFKAINDLAYEHNTKIPVQHLLWDDTHSSEACLSSLVDFLGVRPTPATRFIKHVARALHLPEQSNSPELTNRIKAYLTTTGSCWAFIGGLMLGFLMTIIGYIGCFTIVQGSSVPSDTYIWLGAEATLALVRLLVWGFNPSWDDSDGICLAATEILPLPAVTPTWVAINAKQFPMFRIMGETEFWQAMTAYSGPVDIHAGYPRGSQRWYSWIKGEGAEIQLICIIVEGQETVLCRLDKSLDMKFYHADLNFNPGHVVQKEELRRDHELMKEETNFKLDVFTHFHSILSAKDRARDHVGQVKASWPLSESSVMSLVIVNGGISRQWDVEHGGLTETLWPLIPKLWSPLVEIMDELFAGRELGYKQISIYRGIISNTRSSKDLHQRLSHYLSVHTKKIYARGAWRDDQLRKYYNTEWEIYSRGIIYLDRLFGSLTVNRVKGDREKAADIHTFLNMALEHWTSNVLDKVSIRLRQLAMDFDAEVGRVITLFTSEDWTRVDFWNMKIKDKNDRSVLEEASADGRTEIVRLFLEADLVNGAPQYDKALEAASSSGHIAIVRLLLQKGADINAARIPVLHTASSSGQLDVVQILLESGADVNALGGEYATALQAACSQGHEMIVRLLLQTGADVNTLGGKYGSALNAAFREGHRDSIVLLLEAGADVNTLGGGVDTLLQEASRNGDTALVRLLVQKRADVTAGKYVNALHAASFAGHEDVVHFLLEAGADVNTLGGVHNSLLQEASQNGDTALVRLLVKRGAVVTAGKYVSALHAATLAGHEDIVHLLLDAGVDVNSSSGEYGSALHAASYGGHTAIVRLILEQGAEINASRNDYGTALEAACFAGHTNVVQLLLDAGADVNRLDKTDTSPLHVASPVQGQQEIVSLPLEAGTKYGGVLHAASFAGHEDIIHLLLEANVDVNVWGSEYYTALKEASEQGHEKIVLLLLEAAQDADVDKFRGGYNRALQAASSKGHIGIVQLLLTKGADVNASSQDYGSALRAACFADHEDVVHVLLEAGADVHKWGSDYDAALKQASERGHEKTVFLLLEAAQDADVDKFRDGYNHALQIASYKGHTRIVRLLLAKGADVNASSQDYHGSALRAACIADREDVVHVLLEAGADVHKWDSEYDAALEEASEQGHEKTVLLLLEAVQDADVDKFRGGYNRALQIASYKGYIKIVRLLLAKGTDVNASSQDYYGSALRAACFAGHEDAVHILLDAGADVHKWGSDYDAALEEASEQGHEKDCVSPIGSGAGCGRRQISWRIQPCFADSIVQGPH